MNSKTEERAFAVLCSDIVKMCHCDDPEELICIAFEAHSAMLDFLNIRVNKLFNEDKSE